MTILRDNQSDETEFADGMGRLVQRVRAWGIDV